MYVSIHLYKHWYPISIFCEPGLFIEFPNMHTQLGVYVFLRQCGVSVPKATLLFVSQPYDLVTWTRAKPGGNPLRISDWTLQWKGEFEPVFLLGFLFWSSKWRQAFEGEIGYLGKDTLPETNIAPKKLMVGKLLSYWGGLFSGTMLVSGRVVSLKTPPGPFINVAYTTEVIPHVMMKVPTPENNLVVIAVQILAKPSQLRLPIEK